MAEAKSTEVAAAAKTDVAVYDYGSDVGAGFENVTAADLKIPFLRVLQSNSPQVESVPGAKAGAWLNIVTNALFPDGVEFVPAHHEHYYVEYERAPDGQRLPGGEGFRGIHKATDPMVLAAISKAGSKFARDEATGKIIPPKSPDGFDLIETQYMYGIQVMPDGALLPAVIAFSSTHLPVYQTWLSTAFYEMIPGTAKSKPLFAHRYKIGSVKKTRGANSWYVPTIGFAGGNAKAALLDPKSDLYQAAKSVAKRVVEGQVDVDHAAGGDGNGGDKASSEVPF
jgi:hypothetical protein